MKLKLILQPTWIICLLIIVSSCSPLDKGDENTKTTQLTSIEIGPTIEVASSTIPAAGGSIKVSKPGTPVDGMEITIPANSFTSSQTFKVSYSEIKSHDFGQNFNPISPMISVTNDSGYSNDGMRVKIPIKLPAGHFAMGFLYDKTTGKLEGMPIESLDNNFITVDTRHFAKTSSQLKKGSEKNGISDDEIIGDMIISSISETVLNGQTIISSGFTPGADDWEFVNYGSYISPGGHCAGQSLTAMWYYYEKKLKGASSLFHLYDQVNTKTDPALLWQDNPFGYRFASTIQEDFGWDGWFGWVTQMNFRSIFPALVWKAFAFSMLVTGEPQSVLINNSHGLGGHAMIVYKINFAQGKLYIADPNYPNNIDPGTKTESIRTIDFVNGKFNSYYTGLTAGANSTEMDQISYFGKTAYIDWNQIGKRWTEFENKTIGTIAPNIFPAYTIWVKDGAGYELKDGTTTTKDTLRTIAICPTAEESYIVANQKIIGTDIFDQNGTLLSKAESNGQVRVILKPGLNKLGYCIIGWRKDYKTTDGTQYINKFVDFKWINVTYSLAVETNPVTNITSTTATSGGNVKSDGGFSVTARGVCWSTSSNPTTANSKTTDGNGTGLFPSNLTGLTANTLYYVRAYATNSIGTAYGTQVSFTTTSMGQTGTVTDIDGNIYNTVTIGTQVWMKENLKTTKYNDGTAIPNITVNATWANSNTGAYGDYNNTPANSTTYGRLYNWYAVDNNAATKVASNGGKNVCPTSWHVPSDAEWTTLTNFLGGETGAGGKLKETGTTHWTTPNMGATNSSGFSALPGGSRYHYDGTCQDIGIYGYWWSSTKYLVTFAWYRSMYYNYDNVFRSYYEEQSGYSVRCVRDY
ncbi:MAG: fibrobacter succinogenes major paralogous domain-containing protein [Bacteroidia bacterium]|nr:fibrobacter succinogenes major paralogous domain-containing protein [Bacteroidia bacterium]